MIDTAANYLGVIACDLSSAAYVGTAGAWNQFPFMRYFSSASYHGLLAFDLTDNAAEDYVIYGLIKAKDTYTPSSGETFKVFLELATV